MRRRHRRRAPSPGSYRASRRCGAEQCPVSSAATLIEPPTPEDEFRAIEGAPLRLDLRCTRCKKQSPIEVPWAFVSPNADSNGTPPWDGVLLARMFTCPACGAVDEYTLTALSHIKLVAALLRSGTTGKQSRVRRAEAQLWDGTRIRRPAQGLAHLRALTERYPDDPQAWRRLGNFCERYGLPDEAEHAWRLAVERGPDEFEAAYNLAKFKRAEPKVGRNDPCPCGSGKKYKKCHGA